MIYVMSYNKYDIRVELLQDNDGVKNSEIVVHGEGRNEGEPN